MTIKHCPFCGHVGLDFHEGTTFRWVVAECGACGATCGETRVQTLGEGTKDEWMQQAQRDAIEVWNTRAQPAPDLIPLDQLFVCGQMEANITRVYAAPRELSDAEIRRLQSQYPSENDPVPLCRAVFAATRGGV